MGRKVAFFCQESLARHARTGEDLNGRQAQRLKGHSPAAIWVLRVMGNVKVYAFETVNFRFGVFLSHVIIRVPVPG